MGKSESDDRSCAAVYQLLGRLWSEEASASLIADLQRDPLRRWYLKVGGMVPDGPADEARQQLACDYCRLLLGPSRHLPPYQSVWTHERFSAEPASSMLQFFSLVGEAQDPEDMPDQLGLQLQLMGTFVEETGSSNDAEELHELARTYFRLHLCWPTPFLNAVHNEDPDGFYGRLARVTQQFLSLERVTWLPNH